MESVNFIHSYVDTALDHLARADMMRIPDREMPPEMYDTSRAPHQDWKPWKAIPSTVTDEDLDDLETQTGLEFPPLYRTFLKYKHFDTKVKLDDGDHPVVFWDH